MASQQKTSFYPGRNADAVNEEYICPADDLRAPDVLATRSTGRADRLQKRGRKRDSLWIVSRPTCGLGPVAVKGCRCFRCREVKWEGHSPMNIGQQLINTKTLTYRCPLCDSTNLEFGVQVWIPQSRWDNGAHKMTVGELNVDWQALSEIVLDRDRCHCLACNEAVVPVAER